MYTPPRQIRPPHGAVPLDVIVSKNYTKHKGVNISFSAVFDYFGRIFRFCAAWYDPDCTVRGRPWLAPGCGGPNELKSENRRFLGTARRAKKPPAASFKLCGGRREGASPRGRSWSEQGGLGCALHVGKGVNTLTVPLQLKMAVDSSAFTGVAHKRDELSLFHLLAHLHQCL